MIKQNKPKENPAGRIMYEKIRETLRGGKEKRQYVKKEDNRTKKETKKKKEVKSKSKCYMAKEGKEASGKAKNHH